MSVAEDKKRFPKMFIIGAPKCGTTSLYRWLSEHPNTHLPAKEPNYFSTDLYDVYSSSGRIKPSYDEYIDRFCPPEKIGMLTGEATPKYLYSDDALDILGTFRDQVKIIVALRNPVDLVASMHSQMCKQGQEREFDFTTAWNRKTEQENVLTNYRLWGKFGTRLEKVLQTFPRENVLVLIMEEDLAVNKIQTYQRILNFLSLPDNEPSILNNKNTATRAKSKVLHLFLAKLRKIAKKYKLLEKKWLPVGLFKKVGNLNRVKGRESKLGDTIRKEITQYFYEDVRLTCKLLKRDDLPWPDFFEPSDDSLNNPVSEVADSESGVGL